MQLIDRMRRAKVDVVVRERHYPAGLAETVAQRAGAKLVELPVMVGGLLETKTYVGLIDYNLRAMLRAVSSWTAPHHTPLTADPTSRETGCERIATRRRPSLLV